MEPAPPSKYAYKDKDLKDNPMHIFEIKETEEVRNTWRDIANMSVSRPSLLPSQGERKDVDLGNDIALQRLESNARRYLAMARDSLPPSTSAEADARDRWLQACQPPKLGHAIDGSSFNAKSTSSSGDPKQRPESSPFEGFASTLTPEGERKAKEAGKRLSWNINSQNVESNLSAPSTSENRWATYRIGTEDASPFLSGGQRLVLQTRPYTTTQHERMTKGSKLAYTATRPGAHSGSGESLARLVTQAELEEKMRDFEANLMSKVEAAMERLTRTMPSTSSDLEAAKEFLKSKPFKMSDADIQVISQDKDSAFTDTDKAALDGLIEQNASIPANPEVIYKGQDDNITSTDPVSPTSGPTIQDAGDIVVQAVQTLATGVGMLGSAVSKKLPELEEKLSNAQQNLPERIDSVVSQAIGGIETRTESLANALQQASDASRSAADRTRQADLSFEYFMDGLGGFVSHLGKAVFITPGLSAVLDDSPNAQAAVSADTSTVSEASMTAAKEASQLTSPGKALGKDQAFVEKEESATHPARQKERQELTASKAPVSAIDNFLATSEVTAAPSDLRRHHSMVKLAPSHIDSVGKDRFPHRHSHFRRHHEHLNGPPRTNDTTKSIADQYRHRIQHLQSTPTLNQNTKPFVEQDELRSTESRAVKEGNSHQLRPHLRIVPPASASTDNAKPPVEARELRKNETLLTLPKLVDEFRRGVRHDLRSMQSTPTFSGKTKPILDQEDPDPDFSARYPSLLSSNNALHRSNTTTGAMSDSWYLRPLNPESEISRFPTVSQLERHDTPREPEKLPSVPKPSIADSGFLQHLPGAWPQASSDVKPISEETHKPAAESSGAFFERMTGRRAATFEEFMMEPITDESTNLRRAHTTAGNTKRSGLERVEQPRPPPALGPRQTLWSQSQFTAPRNAANTFLGARRPYSTHYTGTGRTGPLNSIIQTSPPQRQSRPRSLHNPVNPSAAAPTSTTFTTPHVREQMRPFTLTRNPVRPRISTIPLTPAAPAPPTTTLPSRPLKSSNPPPPAPVSTLPSHHRAHRSTYQQLNFPEDKIRTCVQNLRMLGYDRPPSAAAGAAGGSHDTGNSREENNDGADGKSRAAIMERLWLYARMTNGNLEEAIEMLEEERRAWESMGGRD